jgi:hypothetical protein
MLDRDMGIRVLGALHARSTWGGGVTGGHVGGRVGW